MSSVSWRWHWTCIGWVQLFFFWLVQLLCLVIGPFWAGWASIDCLHIRFVQFFQGSTIKSREVSQKRVCCCFIGSVIRSGWRKNNSPENFPVSQQKGSKDEIDYKQLWKWVQATLTMLYLFIFIKNKVVLSWAWLGTMWRCWLLRTCWARFSW